VDEVLIYRGEVVQLLFGVSDIVESLGNIEAMLRGGDDGEEEEVDEG
jgi:hypothetical protein